MSGLASLVVCVLCLGAAADEAVTRLKDVIVISDVHAERSYLIQGVIICQEFEPAYGPSTFETFVTKNTKTDDGSTCKYVSPKYQLFPCLGSEGLLSAMVRKLVTDELKVNNKVPANKIVAADFKLYVAVSTTGDVRLNSKQEEYFKQDAVTYAGYAEVSYRKAFLAAYPERTDITRHYWICNAFESLAKQLKCQAIWVREGSRLGVAWGGDGWCYNMITQEQETEGKEKLP